MTSTISKWFIMVCCTLLLAACSGAPVNHTATPAATPSAESGGQQSGAASSSEGGQAAALTAKYEQDDLNAEWSLSDAVSIALEGNTASIDGDGAVADGGVVTISSGGLYVLGGLLNDGQIVVDAPDDQLVRLVLNGVQLASTTSAPIYVKEAGKVVVTLADGTQNSVTDTETYIYPDAATDEPSAAIFSKADLTFNGSGSLTVAGKYNDAINGRDDVKFVSGIYFIESADDGIVGKDMVGIAGGEFTINAASDGIKSSNDQDATKGYISITGGDFAIRSGNDGLQAETMLAIDDGTFDLVTGGGHANAAPRTEQSGGFGGRQMQGVQAEESDAAEEEETSDSMKGLKAGVALIITGGNLAIDAADDALHSNGAVTVSGGQFRLATGDDGIHADGTASISGGIIDITQSYEGVEGTIVDISGGELRIVASDDGINAAGNDGLNNMIRFSGGYVTVDAQGDGLDANGNIEMTGGVVFVNGPTGNGNGALDYDGNFNISGGTLVAAGSSGMAMATSDSSAQPTVSMLFSASQQAGTNVTLKDADGNELISYAPSKTFQSIVFSTPELKQGETYAIYAGGQEIVSFAIGQSVVWVNESGVTTGGNQGFGGGRGGMGGGAGGQGGRQPGGQGGQSMMPGGGEGPGAMPEGGGVPGRMPEGGEGPGMMP